MAFYATLAHHFRSKGGVCLPSPSSARLGRWVSARLPEEPPSLLHGARGRSGVPLAFYATLAHPFRSEGGVCLPSPSSVSLGRWVSARFAGRAPKPPHRVRGRSGVPLAFYATLAHPFRLEGEVEYARLPSVGASGDTSGELVSGKSEWRPMPRSIRVG